MDAERHAESARWRGLPDDMPNSDRWSFFGGTYDAESATSPRPIDSATTNVIVASIIEAVSISEHGSRLLKHWMPIWTSADCHVRDERWSAGPCPIERAMARIGDSWTLLILRDASRGLARFDDFRLSLEIAPNILARRLAALVETGLLERIPYQSHPPRFRYVLTQCGRDFLPVLHAVGAWSRKHLAGPHDVLTPSRIDVIVIDEATGRPVDTSAPVWP